MSMKRWSTADRHADWERRVEEAGVRAEARAQAKQHAKGKLSARERIERLLDPGSFVELDQLARQRSTSATDDRPYGDGVVTGRGKIHGRPVCVFSQDFSVFGGSMGEAFGEKVLKVMDLATRIGCPVIGLNDSGGARIQEGVVSLAYYAELGRRNAISSGVVPQISMILGPCAGGAVYSPAMTDFTVMVRDISHMYVTGPDVVRAVTGEDVTHDELGGADVNADVAGNAHYVADDEEDAIDWVRFLLSYLPANNLEQPPRLEPVDVDPDRLAELDSFIPTEESVAYDVREVVRRLVDDEELFEISPTLAPNIVCGFARIGGDAVGVVANQPMHQAGTIDIAASEKAARFVRFCDAFNIPIVTFVDVPGYLPGTEQERAGIIRRGAKLIFSYAEATVPKVTVVLRKAYGGGYAVMGSKHLGADVNLAWPTAQIAVMGATGAVELLHRRQLAELDPEHAAEAREKLISEYERTLATPYIAAERGYLDAVIAPSQTRAWLLDSLEVLRNKREDRPHKKHGNIPL